MIKDFWCDKCKIDVSTFSYVREYKVYKDYCYIGFCPDCKAKLIRYPDDKISKDPYYRKSYKNRLFMEKHKKDLVQPGQPGFKTLYKEQADKMEEAEQKQEQRKIKEKKERDKFIKEATFNTPHSKKKLIDVIERAEAISNGERPE